MITEEKCPGDTVGLEGRGLLMEEIKEETSRLKLGKSVWNRPLLSYIRRAVRETV